MDDLDYIEQLELDDMKRQEQEQVIKTLVTDLVSLSEMSYALLVRCNIPGHLYNDYMQFMEARHAILERFTESPDGTSDNTSDNS